jgi:hypothetical protein
MRRTVYYLKHNIGRTRTFIRLNASAACQPLCPPMNTSGHHHHGPLQPEKIINWKHVCMHAYCSGGGGGGYGAVQSCLVSARLLNTRWSPLCASRCWTLARSTSSQYRVYSLKVYSQYIHSCRTCGHTPQLRRHSHGYSMHTTTLLMSHNVRSFKLQLIVLRCLRHLDRTFRPLQGFV